MKPRDWGEGAGNCYGCPGLVSGTDALADYVRCRHDLLEVRPGVPGPGSHAGCPARLAESPRGRFWVRVDAARLDGPCPMRLPQVLVDTWDLMVAVVEATDRTTEDR